mgnify:CR=1 FL=1
MLQGAARAAEAAAAGCPWPDGARPGVADRLLEAVYALGAGLVDMATVLGLLAHRLDAVHLRLRWHPPGRRHRTQAWEWGDTPNPGRAGADLHVEHPGGRLHLGWSGRSLPARAPGWLDEILLQIDLALHLRRRSGRTAAPAPPPFEGLPLGLVLVDETGRIRAADRTAASLLEDSGVAPGSLPGALLVRARQAVPGEVLVWPGTGLRVTMLGPLDAPDAQATAGTLLRVEAGPAATAAPLATEAGLALTRSESAVLSLLLAGLGNAEIARVRRVSVETVRTQVRAVLAKLGCPDRRALLVRHASLGVPAVPVRSRR